MMRLATGAGILILISAGCSGAAAPARPPAKVHRFQRRPEPRENAFTIPVPVGWQMRGGIVRVNPSLAGGAGNAIAAKLDLSIQRDDAGTAMLRMLPDVAYVDMRGSPAAAMGAFPPGSNYNGMTVYPLMRADAFLTQVAFRYAHPQARNVKVLRRKPLPSLVEELRLMGRFIPIVNQFQYDAALVFLTYEEGGRTYKEALSGAIESMGALGAGMWGNKRCGLIRAPEGEFESLVPLFWIMLSNIEINSQWLAGEIRGQMTRAGIAADVQRTIQEIDRQITEHRQRTNAEINNDVYLTLTGQEEYINPHSGQVERRPNDWKYRWVNASGEEVYTDQDYYDPNVDPNSRRGDFKRSPVRPRFPQ